MEQAGQPEAAPSLALFRCLLAKDTDGATQLLNNAPPGSLALQGPQGFTALHAAVGACAAGLLPTLAAAGAPLNMPMQLWGYGQQDLRGFLRSCGLDDVLYEQFGCLHKGMTPLGFAAAQAAQDGGACALALLGLGVDVNAGCPLPLAALLEHHNIAHGDANLALAAELLRRGADCLAPIGGPYKVSMLATAPSRRLPSFLFAHATQQLQQGQLQIDCLMTAASVLQLGANWCHQGLLQHAVQWLRAHAALGADAAGPLDAYDRHALAGIVGSLAVNEGVDDDALMALLSWQLPISLEGTANARLLHSAAVHVGRSEAALQALHALGAPLPMYTLLSACALLHVGAVRGLLACGAPAVDTSRAVRRPRLDGLEFEWACPFHQVMAGLAKTYHVDQRGRAAQTALQCVQLLQAAGYTPTVYVNVQTWQTHGALSRLRDLPPVLGELDPFDEALPLFPDWIKQTSAYQLARSLVRPLEWSIEWPPAFKLAARTLLLAAAGHRHQGLGLLPSGVLLHIVRFAGRDVAAWLGD